MSPQVNFKWVGFKMSPTLNGIPKISKVYMSSKKCKPGRSKYRNCFQPGRHARLKIQKYAEYPKQIISGIMIIRYNLAALIACASLLSSLTREFLASSNNEIITGTAIWNSCISQKSVGCKTFNSPVTIVYWVQQVDNFPFWAQILTDISATNYHFWKLTSFPK